jgi:regulatory protein
MAQSWRVKLGRDKKPRPPLDPETLERLGLHYVGRYATTRAKLRDYLGRKVRERGWEGPPPQIGALVERFGALGYLDDSAFAEARAASLQLRGYGERRVSDALRAAGIEEADAAGAKAQAREGAMASAIAFARRKRIGPFAPEQADRDAQHKAFAAMMRAGHRADVVRRVLNASADDIPECDTL